MPPLARLRSNNARCRSAECGVDELERWGVRTGRGFSPGRCRYGLHATRVHPILDAAHVSALLHRRQRRKDAEATPYINHPIAVAQLLREYGVDDVTAIAAALLHDTIEDTGVTREQLAGRYGPAVAGVVAEVSDDKSLPKARRKELQVEHAPRLSQPARLVKLGDKVRNLEDVLASPPRGWSAHQKHDYFLWAKRVVDGLRGTHAALEARFDSVYARHGEFVSRREREGEGA